MLSKINNVSTYNHFFIYSTYIITRFDCDVYYDPFLDILMQFTKTSHFHKYGEIALIQWAFRIIPIRLLEVAHEPIKQGLLCYEIYLY